MAYRTVTIQRFCLVVLGLIFIFAAMSPQYFGKETQLTSSECKNEGCLLSLNHVIIRVLFKPKCFCWLKFVNLVFRHKEQNIFHPNKRHNQILVIKVTLLV